MDGGGGKVPILANTFLTPSHHPFRTNPHSSTKAILIKISIPPGLQKLSRALQKERVQSWQPGKCNLKILRFYEKSKDMIHQENSAGNKYKFQSCGNCLDCSPSAIATLLDLVDSSVTCEEGIN